MVVQRRVLPIFLALCGAASPGLARPEPAPSAPVAPGVVYGEIPITTSAPAALPFFRAGRLKALNFELVAAAEQLERALALDPGFAQAMAWLGKCDPGPAGLAQVEKAASLAQSYGEAERLSIEALLAERRGDGERLRALRRKLADLAPRDWLSQYQLGVQSFYDHKSQAAILYFNRAVQLRPDLAEPYMYLAYLLALQGNAEAGVAAARKLVELQIGRAHV